LLLLHIEVSPLYCSFLKIIARIGTIELFYHPRERSSIQDDEYMRKYGSLLVLAIFVFSITAVPSVTAASPFSLEGALRVTSSPPGAAVTIDSVYAGTTPVTVSNLALGYHSIALKKTGYQDQIARGYVNFRQTATVSATMVPVGDLPVPTTSPSPTETHPLVIPTPTPLTSPFITPTPAPTSLPPAISQSLRVVSDPADAVVKLDHVVVGKTPLSITDISPGMHTITIEKEGYREYEKQITVQPGWFPLLVAVLVPESTGPAPTVTPTTPPVPTTYGPDRESSGMFQSVRCECVGGW
jgi:hypothetical protein